MKKTRNIVPPMKEPEIKTKIGSRIKITSVPFGITNLSVGIEGETIEDAQTINDFVQVKIKLDDGRIISWKESNLEVLDNSTREKEEGGDAPDIEIISDSPSIDQVSTEDTEEKQKEIELIRHDDKLFAKVKDLRKHPLNEQIYSHDNVNNRLEEIKRSGWIETLAITPSGLIISGNTRHECAEILGWEQVQVEVREFANEREETKALLLYNSSREKTREELCREAMVWELIEKKEAADRRKQTQNNKPNVDEGADQSNLTVQTEKSTKKGQARDFAAKQVGLKPINYEKMKKIVKTADRLKEDNRKGAAKKLLKALNSGSTDAAYKQIKDLNKVEGAIDALKQSFQNEAASILDDILENHSIKDAIEQMKEWEKDYKRRTSNFQHLDVVRIKSEEQKGEWGILDVYDEEKLTGVVMTVLGELQVQLVNLERIELSEEKKQKAYDLMIRLQRSSYQLQGKNQPIANQMLQEIARKKNPTLNSLEEAFLLAIEVFLTGAIEEIKKRSLEVLKFKSKEQKKLKIKN